MSPSGSSNAPEAKARTRIDQALAESGWTLQDRDDMNLAAAPTIAVREFKLDKGHGYVDYMLFLDGHPVGVCEAKPAGAALIGVEHQVKKYVQGIPAALAAPYKPLPFAYLSTGEETLFINHFDPHPRTRPVFSFHRPDTLREWLTADTLDGWLKRSGGLALVRLVDLRVVEQLAWALKAGVEVLLALMPVAFEDVTATLGEDDQRAAVADRNGSHELLFSQVPEFAAAWIEGVAPAVPQVVGVHDAERAGRRQRPRFRAAQEDAVLAEPHALAVWTARQIEITSEHLTRVARVSFERVGRDASTALVQLTS